MTTYKDHSYKSLQYENELGIVKQLSSGFDSFSKAFVWLLKNGKSVTKKFQKKYNQPCALLVLGKGNEYEDDGVDYDFENTNTPDIYWLDPKFSVVFSEQGYYMTLRENFIFNSRDWDLPFPTWNFYIRSKHNGPFNFKDEFTDIEKDPEFIEHGLRDDEDPDTELNTPNDNNLELICGCNDLYFARLIKDDTANISYHEKEFMKFKKNRVELVDKFNRYIENETDISDFIKKLITSFAQPYNCCDKYASQLVPA